MIRDLDNMVAEMVGVDIPFNNYITGITAFTHKAGIHAKAVLNNPETYEILDAAGLWPDALYQHRPPADGLERHQGPRRAAAAGDCRTTRLKAATAHIKALADEKPLALDDVDAVLRSWIAASMRRGHASDTH